MIDGALPSLSAQYTIQFWDVIVMAGIGPLNMASVCKSGRVSIY